MSKTRGAAGAAAAPQESEGRPRQGDPLEEQIVEPAAQPIVSEGSPSMHGMDRGGRLDVNDVSAATDDAIAARAYELYQARGGTHGADMDDWLQAEQELRGERRQQRADAGQADQRTYDEPENPAHRPID